MNYLKKFLFLLTIFICAAGDIFGQGGQDRAGTAAAPELRIPIGAQYLAQGGAPVATAAGLEAIYWNPAGVFLKDQDANALFSYRQYIADMNMNYAAISGNFGELGTLALSFRDLNIGDINVTTLDQPDGTGEIVSPTYFVLGLTYSRLLSDRVSIGANVNLINESWTGVSASGISFDAGVQYKNLFTNGLSLGVVVKNLGGALTFGGSSLFVQATDPNSARGLTFYEISAASFELPSEISLGLSYTRALDEENSVSVSGAFVNNNFAYDDYKVGLEYSYKDIAFLRGGYLFSPQSSTARPNIFQDYSLGVGLNFKQFTDMDISLDYAYTPVKYFNANNTFSIKMGF